jgi:maltose/moltooligosaccharide transporter
MTPSIAPSPAAGGQHIYNTENLSYTKKGLMVLSFWLLWGDFAFNFFESVFGRFLPIYLKDNQASNTLIGVMTGSFAGLVNVLFLPSISRWNDNLRTPIGRRIPLLYGVTPLVILTVIGVGFAPEMGRWGFDVFGKWLPQSVTKGGLVLGILCMLTVSFHFFNMVLVNGYNWLIRDVVPLEVMSRFLACFRIIGGISGILFLWFVFPHLMTHRHEIFVGVGVFYFFAFFLMCYKVKEGKYPLPGPKENRPGFFKTYGVFFRECLQIPIYRNFFLLALVVTASAQCAGNFITLFASDTLGMNMKNMGLIFACATVFSTIMIYPIGSFCDRFSPLYVLVAVVVINSGLSIAAGLLIHSPTAFMVYTILHSLPAIAWGLGLNAASMKLFPAEKFGQFSGGINVFSCGSLIVGNILIGYLMDFTHSNYRVAFFWMALLSAVSIFPLLAVIRSWKALGGHDNYVAPLPKVDR